LGVVQRITLITGGARSGKSAYALRLAAERPGVRRVYVATGGASDEEMAARIARHKAERPSDFVTVEEPVNVASALDALKGRADIVIIDSLTLWVANLMRIYSGEDAFRHEARTLVHVMEQAQFDSIVVTDEVGSGIVPDNAVARRFRDMLGLANQRIARSASEVLLMVAGLPLKVK
jgi:adenosylcobinamide kinase / adenosylcobinamide-phosphate guanylyltransferase